MFVSLDQNCHNISDIFCAMLKAQNLSQFCISVKSWSYNILQSWVSGSLTLKANFDNCLLRQQFWTCFSFIISNISSKLVEKNQRESCVSGSMIHQQYFSIIVTVNKTWPFEYVILYCRLICKLLFQLKLSNNSIYLIISIYHL